MNIIYCDHDGIPAVYRTDTRQAFEFFDGAWHPDLKLDVFRKAAMIGRARFVARFGELPPVPPRL